MTNFTETGFARAYPIKWLLVCLMLALSILSIDGFAQSAGNYTPTTNTTGSLALDKDGNAINMATGTTQIYGPGVDTYTNFGNVNFGWTFYMMGNAYTQWNANPDGQVRLDGTLLSAHTSSAAAGVPLIIASNIDAITDATTGKVHYKVQAGTNGQVLIIEWLNLKLNWNATGTTLSTFQLRLYQNTNDIEMVYGQMWNSSTSAQSTSIGFSSSNTANSIGQYITLNATPTWNSSSTSFTTTSFTASSAMTNLNSAANGSRRVFRFTPPAAPTTPTTLSLTGTTGTTQPISWADVATNELGYRIFRSTDGSNYTLINTTAANATSFTATGLSFGTLYYWRVVAFNEGGVSGNLDGSKSTDPGSFAGGTYSVGTGETYATLTAAFAAINAAGLTGNVNLELTANYDATAQGLETYPIASSTASAAGSYTITVYPTASGRSITSGNATGTLNLGGAGNLIIDGRVNQTGPKDLVISNTNTAGFAVRFINDASNNIIRYAVIRSVNTGTSSGTILFSNSTGVTGNDNNLISFCDILDGATLPANAIYSAGQSVAIDNSGNTVSNCNIANYFLANGNSNGIFLASSSSAWTISNNKFYQEATRTSTAAALVRAIQIVTASGGGYTISGNVIGYANSAGTGVTTYAGAFANRFSGIEMTANNTTNSVQGNIISGIVFSTTSGATTAPGIFSGIACLGGAVNIGTTTANTVGATSGNGAISITCGTTGGVSWGIYASVASPGALDISNNNVGSVNATGSGATVGVVFNAINSAGSGSVNIGSNNIGSSATANSIAVGTSGVTTAATSFQGIVCASTGTPQNINNNNIYNIVNYSTGTSSLFYGILNSGSIAP